MENGKFSSPVMVVGALVYLGGIPSSHVQLVVESLTAGLLVLSVMPNRTIRDFRDRMMKDIYTFQRAALVIFVTIALGLSGIKFLPKVIPLVWHGAGSAMHNAANTNTDARDQNAGITTLINEVQTRIQQNGKIISWNYRPTINAFSGETVIAQRPLSFATILRRAL